MSALLDPPRFGFCDGCNQQRPRSELTEVVTVRTGRTFLVCRPTVDGRCFRARVGPASVQRIVPAHRKGTEA